MSFSALFFRNQAYTVLMSTRLPHSGQFPKNPFSRTREDRHLDLAGLSKTKH
jgi:hypothetical protein